MTAILLNAGIRASDLGLSLTALAVWILPGFSFFRANFQHRGKSHGHGCVWQSVASDQIELLRAIPCLVDPNWNPRGCGNFPLRGGLNSAGTVRGSCSRSLLQQEAPNRHHTSVPWAILMHRRPPCVRASARHPDPPSAAGVDLRQLADII